MSEPSLTLYVSVHSQSRCRCENEREDYRRMTGDDLQLRQPSIELARSFECMRDACLRNGDGGWAGRTALARSDIPAFIALLNRRALGQDVPSGWVPETTFWVVRSGHQVVGEVELRHPLNDWLRQVGGNVGYLIHPDHRNKGYATFALREGLNALRNMGLEQALVTCREDNVASIRVIEKCGGVRIEDSTATGPARRRYLIPLTSVTVSSGR